MTNIQAKSFGAIFGGSDIIGKSETGSGKTLAFLLPLLMSLKIKKENKIKENKIKENKIKENKVKEILKSAAAATRGTDPFPARPQLVVLAPTRTRA
ncbi:hypothetical protein ETH_00040200 [Eimeria tenella]|uniref:DEAD/DEAH-box helicase domain-containing protein n=1 Tax=Eimeria tenella TaxID=5802 RepID=U6L6B1_EIMTE|nr:hypothetical protein ETH_00040200 [Eimeria tenella]CDJ44743.1 hypothetical protein ETH_00040200 [Eimeria tenella]|eukprot:XP_013235491.1 hypothetical protein ETH_00040200 [Eimeria tenella]